MEDLWGFGLIHDFSGTSCVGRELWMGDLIRHLLVASLVVKRVKFWVHCPQASSFSTGQGLPLSTRFGHAADQDGRRQGKKSLSPYPACSQGAGGEASPNCSATCAVDKFSLDRNYSRQGVTGAAPHDIGECEKSAFLFLLGERSVGVDGAVDDIRGE
jgi:hypothetical protein